MRTEVLYIVYGQAFPKLKMPYDTVVVTGKEKEEKRKWQRATK